MKNSKIKYGLITKNKKAYFDYEIIKTYEAGIVLKGYEVKSIRSGNVNLKGSYIININQELYIKGMHISVWKTLPNKESIDSFKERKILLHKKDILYLISKSKEAGYSIIPLELYFSGSLIKVKIGLVKGRKNYEKKQILKERTLDKEAKMAMKKFM